MANRIAELTPEELATLKALIQDTVYEVLDAYIDDGESDEGLTLRPEVIEELRTYLRKRPPTQEASEIFRELGLDV